MMEERPPQRIVIFAHARSGSTSLYRLLQLHPLLNMALEPFWDGFAAHNPGEKNYVDLIQDIPSLEWALEDLFSKYNGIKILDYQLPEELYTHLLLMPHITVLFLRRRNLLQASVSGCIAKQTKVWQISDMTEKAERIYRNLQPASLTKIADELAYGRHLRDYYSRVIAQRPEGSYLKIIYEELYTGDLQTSRAVAREIFQFLGLELPEGEALELILDPRTSKINTPETYALLPNAVEINERLGTDETGWLFEPGE
jgi:hypothetical protein